MARNPFVGPYSGTGPFSEGITDPSQMRICCPNCKAEDFDAHANQYEVVRTCRVCKNKWSGGSMGAAQPDLRFPLGPPGTPEPDEVPDHYTGANFRDPSKTYGSED